MYRAITVGGEAKSKEVKCVGAVCLWSNVYSGVRVDVASWSEDNLWDWRGVSLITYLSPVCYLSNREFVRNSIFTVGKSLVSLIPKG